LTNELEMETEHYITVLYTYHRSLSSQSTFITLLENGRMRDRLTHIFLVVWILKLLIFCFVHTTFDQALKF